MNVIHRLLPVRRPVAAGVVVVAAAAAAVAVALASGAAPPPPLPLDQALEQALAASPPAGITAQLTLSDHLFDGADLGMLSSLPLLSGGTGELWLAPDGDARLDLTSSGGVEAELLLEGTTLTLYLPAADTALRLTLPAPPASGAAATAPSLDDIDHVLAALGRFADVSTATPGTIAGEPAYTVAVTPQAAGAPSASFSFDASTGVPLAFSLVPAGASTPTLAFTVTAIAYGAVPASVVDPALPVGVDVVDVPLPALPATPGDHAAVTGLPAVAGAVGFTLAAPPSLDGLARGAVRLVGSGADAGALIVYGGAGKQLLVAETPSPGSGGLAAMLLGLLPPVSVDGASGHVLSTSLGSVLSVERDGVAFTLAGSVDESDAEAAAQALLS